MLRKTSWITPMYLSTFCLAYGCPVFPRGVRCVGDETDARITFLIK
jgi:hypothetical protein